MNLRNVERPQLMTYLEVRCAESGRTVGRIIDLTTTGMRLITNDELEIETDFHLVIPVETSIGAPEDLRIDARCMWVGRDVNPELHCAGFEFEHVRPRQEDLLSRLIRTHRFEHQHS